MVCRLPEQVHWFVRAVVQSDLGLRQPFGADPLSIPGGACVQWYLRLYSPRVRDVRGCHLLGFRIDWRNVAWCVLHENPSICVHFDTNVSTVLSSLSAASDAAFG